jgi:uncharacterized protein (TIRG00374 family)
MRNFLLFLISLLIGIGLFFWIAGIVDWEEIKSTFLTFTGWQGLVILGLTLLMAMVGTWKWKEILKGCGNDVPLRNLLNPYLAGFSVMFLAPILIWGGEIFRSYILKERNSISWSRGMASVIIDRILEWTANLAVIFFGGIFFLSMIGLPPIKLVIIFGGAFLIFSAGLCFFYFKSIRRESIISFLIRNNKPFDTEKEIFNFFKAKNKALWKGIALAFLRASVMYVRAWLLIMFLGKSIGGLAAISVLGFSYLAVMIPIPTALGSHEALQMFAFGSLGLGVSIATAFTMIIRGAELILALLGIVILFRLGIILIKDMLFKKIDKIAGDNE